MIRLTIFVIALLLAIGAIAPTGPWLVTLAVLSGIELMRIGPFGWRPWRTRRLRAWIPGPGGGWEEEW